MADYRLENGDIIELSSVTVPEMRGRLRIQVDGSISIPLIGRMEAAGLTLSQVQDNLQKTFASKVLRQRSGDGRETLFLIQPYDVVATIAEFRPVYVTGDVSKPGEQTYRPNMTVRQAIAIAGGLDVARYRATNPLVEAAELKGDYEAQSVESVKRRIAIWRIRTELGSSEALDEAELAKAQVEPGLVRRLVQTERSLLDSRNRDHQAERTYLVGLIRQADQQIQILTEQRGKEEQGREEDSEELRRAQEMLGKGTLTTQRVTEARRAVLLSSTRRLQTDAQLAVLQKQRAEAASNLERLDGQRRMRLNLELVEYDAALSAVTARLHALSEKIKYIGRLRSSLNAGGVKVSVVRGSMRMNTSEDAALKPGDVVEIELRTGAGPTLEVGEN